jgi:uncharacterized protein with HEPN domain
MRIIQEASGLIPKHFAEAIGWTANHLYSTFRSKYPSLKHLPMIRKRVGMSKDKFWKIVADTIDPSSEA